MPPSQYNSNEILSMQQDAIRRVREMQKRARRAMEQPPNRTNASGQNQGVGHSSSESSVLGRSGNRQEQDRREQNALPVSSGSHHQKPEKKHDNFLSGLLNNLNMGEDSILILMILFLLASEKADPVLLLALGYILL